MKLIKNLLATMIVVLSAQAFAGHGGDDVGNGGHAYRQSVVILKMASAALEEKIKTSTVPDLINHPEWRMILQDTLSYEDLEKLSKKNRYRGGKKLAMDYVVNPATVVLLKPYFEAFMGRTDAELEEASLEVQKRLVHEAAHIWGFKEEDAEKFAVAFMRPPVIDDPRPSHDISIKNDFCSCLKGKSDIVNNCDSFCASKPSSDSPILYVNTLIGPQTALHSKLGNLYNWCTVQLSEDETTPQCMLVATDGTDELSMPINVLKNSNSFSANIIQLSKNKTWLLKLVETRTGSNAETKEFQIRRKDIESNLPGPIGALKVSSVDQYTCLNYIGKIDSQGSVYRGSYARLYYYITGEERPEPIPPVGNGNQSLIVCHDEQVHPGSDSPMYERLERERNSFSTWDKSDLRFLGTSSGKLAIHKELEDRLADEYGIHGSSINIFNLLSFPSSPNTKGSIGFIMMPFRNPNTGVNVCPTSNDYSGSLPLMNLLGEYMGDTEGLYTGEVEGVVLESATLTKVVYVTTFVRESSLLSYCFYVENGLKIRIDKTSLNSKTVYYYTPMNSSMDPLNSNGRKLVTIRRVEELRGMRPEGSFSLDRKLGCIPKM